MPPAESGDYTVTRLDSQAERSGESASRRTSIFIRCVMSGALHLQASAHPVISHLSPLDSSLLQAPCCTVWTMRLPLPISECRSELPVSARSRGGAVESRPDPGDRAAHHVPWPSALRHAFMCAMRVHHASLLLPGRPTPAAASSLSSVPRCCSPSARSPCSTRAGQAQRRSTALQLSCPAAHPSQWSPQGLPSMAWYTG